MAWCGAALSLTGEGVGVGVCWANNTGIGADAAQLQKHGLLLACFRLQCTCNLDGQIICSAVIAVCDEAMELHTAAAAGCAHAHAD
jgi:hypothetical protein